MTTNKAMIRKTSGRSPRHIVVGDVHGELVGLKEILCQAGLIDQSGHWIGGKAVLVQTGDVIDRGSHSVEAVQFLRTLQEQAAAADGKVVRLCGNHELMLLQGNCRYANFEDPAGIADQLRRDILVGKMHASYSDGTWLYTHAGLRTIVRQSVEEGTTKLKGLKGLSDWLNRIFVDCIKTGDLETHPIFHVDSIRGGSHEIGGIFWGDYSRIMESENAYDIPQVFGHTPTRKNGVEHSHGLKMIDIDAGMYKGYGGHRVYLEIGPDGRVYEHSLTNGKWAQKELSPGAQGRRGAA
jgi:hypothetical protein